MSSQFRDDGSACAGVVWGCMALLFVFCALVLTVWLLGEAGIIPP